MFDAKKHVQADGPSGSVLPVLAHLRRSILNDEYNILRARRDALEKAVSAVKEECNHISTTVEALQIKTRDAVLNSRQLSATELHAQSAALDRLSNRSDVLRTDLARLLQAQKDVATQVKSLEEQLSVHTRVTMTEDGASTLPMRGATSASMRRRFSTSTPCRFSRMHSRGVKSQMMSCVASFISLRRN